MPLVLLLLLMAVGSLGSSLCPGVCKCKLSKRDALTADCSFHSLTAAPKKFPIPPTVLDMSGNVMHKLLTSSFAGKGLARTRAFVLRECQIAELEANSFKGLPGLRKLDLSFNQLKRVEAGMFPKGLRVLDVRGNNDLDCLTLKRHFKAAAPKLRFLCSQQARRSAV